MDDEKSAIQSRIHRSLFQEAFACCALPRARELCLSSRSVPLSSQTEANDFNYDF
jgi:hypothetical protein